MDYIPPLNALPGDEGNADRPHWNADPWGTNLALRSGAFPSAIGFEASQREIVNAIELAGLIPDPDDYTQLGQAITALASASVPTPEDFDMSDILKAVYPPGSFYINKTDGRNPNVIFGYVVGTWVKIEDKMIMAAGTAYGAGTTGGSATTTQTGSQVANHAHSITGSRSVNGTPQFIAMHGDIGSGYPQSHTTDAAGAGNPMITISPYIAAHVWERTV